MRNMSNFQMKWLFDSPEKAKLTGGLLFIISSVFKKGLAGENS